MHFEEAKRCQGVSVSLHVLEGTDFTVVIQGDVCGEKNGLGRCDGCLIILIMNVLSKYQAPVYPGDVKRSALHQSPRGLWLKKADSRMLWEYRRERHHQTAGRGGLHIHRTRGICTKDFGE